MHDKPVSQEFEKIYQRYEYAPLVKLALDIGALLQNHLVERRLRSRDRDHATTVGTNHMRPESG